MVPLGQRYQQTLYLFKKVKGVLQAEPLQPTFFVPMMGRAEEERAVPADPGKPVLVNGDFQNAPDGQPAGWYYVRQAKVEPAAGRRAASASRFKTTTPGRAAQALQAVGVDGRQTHEIEISLWVRGLRVQPGSLPEQRPGLVVVFFNANREPVSKQGIGPWSGTLRLGGKASAHQSAPLGPPGERGGGSVGRDRASLGGPTGAARSSLPSRSPAAANRRACEANRPGNGGLRTESIPGKA